jgi:Phosphotransferase enzyme family
VLRAWQDRPFADLLEELELDGYPEFPFSTDGWSGARFATIDRATDQFVVKRTSLATDWIAAATLDTTIREACLAADAGARRTLPVPYLGAAADGDEAAIVMPDLSVELVAWERPAHEPVLPVEHLDRIIGAIARLHADPWPSAPELDFPWCPLPERLLLTSRPMCARHRASGIPAGVTSAERLLEGWDAFDRQAPVAARELVSELSADVLPLVAALARLPSAGLHGDLKSANVALGADDEDVSFIDWSMTIRAPVAVELGWLLVSNSASLPEPPTAVLDRYRSWIGPRAVLASVVPGAAGVDVIGDWEAQVDLAWIVGLLLRGWRKGLDAERGAVLGSGVSGAEDLAWWSTAAVDAARRRLWGPDPVIHSWTDWQG